MTDKPILFSAPMIRALRDGRKTQTRRVIKLNGMMPDFCGGGPRGGPDWNDPAYWGWQDPEHGDWVTLEREKGQRMGWRDWRGAWRAGDRLWVREGHALVPRSAYAQSEGVAQQVNPSTVQAAIFREGFDRSQGGIRWRPSIHMPRWASRLTLVVTDVRVQRLTEISEADAVAEGVLAGGEQMPVDHFRDLWNSINGSDAWDANPWVVALTFTVHRRNIDQMKAAA